MLFSSELLDAAVWIHWSHTEDKMTGLYIYNFINLLVVINPVIDDSLVSYSF